MTTTEKALANAIQSTQRRPSSRTGKDATVRGKSAAALGAWVRFWRKRAELSQVDLAELVDRKQATISRWENGDDAVSAIELKTLVSIFRERGLDVTPPIETEKEQTRGVPVKGYVGDGGVVRYIDDGWGSIEGPVSELPPDASAFIIDADAVGPFERGWVVYVDAATDTVRPGLSLIVTREFGTVFGTLIAVKGNFLLDRFSAPVRSISRPLETYPVLFISTTRARTTFTG